MTAPKAETLPAPGARTAARRGRDAPKGTWKNTLARYVLAIGGVLGALMLIAIYIDRRARDPGAARQLVARELALPGALEPGEATEAQASLMQRQWWDYYRPTPSTVLATDRRLLLLVVPPRVLPPAAWDPVPPSVEHRSLPYDSVAATTGRVFFGTDRGLILRVRSTGERITLSAYPGEESRMNSVLRIIRRKEIERRIAIERERRLQRLADMRSREAIYHVVQPGEAVSSIADLYGITPEQLRQLNQLPGDRIRGGQRLLVKPAETAPPADTLTPSPTKQP